MTRPSPLATYLTLLLCIWGAFLGLLWLAQMVRGAM